MTTPLVQKLAGVRDFKKILETAVKELGETYAADVSQIVLSNPLDNNQTSICEYKADQDIDPNDLPSMTFPLPLQGVGLGMLSLARREPMTENEINWIRITLAELCDIVRHAQINDVVQRDTFRDTFLVEIGNVMNYSLGIGDALFMVVNILGKVLNSSRCLFICVDDSKAGWKYYEYFQRESVPSCQEFAWPTKDSPIIARSLLTESPMILHEGNQNSYLTPVQEELSLLGVRSLLGVPLRSENATHGCIILQQCHSRHAWTRGEIDMVQNVADTVAEALAKLPEEKKVREPIMRLHQREVGDTAGDSKESILAVRRALRGAMGGATIQSAQKTSQQMPKPPAEALPPTQAPAAQAPSTSGWDAPPPAATPPAAAAQQQAAFGVGGLADAIMNEAEQAAQTGEAGASLNSLLGGLRGTTGELLKPLQPTPPPPAVPDAAGTPWDGDAAASAEGEQPVSALDKWDNLELDAIPTPGKGPSAAPPATEAASPWGDLDSIGTNSASAPQAVPPQPPATEPAASSWSNLDSIPTPSAAAKPADPGPWGNLDAIPTPASGSARGLGGAMLSKKTSNAAAASPLLASLHKDKTKFDQARQQPSTEFVEGPPIEIDEKQAEAKLKQILESSTNATSDYIFATNGLDPRMLGRIDGWISQVEQKDKYESGHAVPVAEYSQAIAKLIGMPQNEIDTVRLAAIVHDVGKLGLAANILQKAEEELSDTELLLIMKHPIDGSNLLEGFPELEHLAQIVLSHHEEYDGNGFPAGLSGEDIPFAARIIHVASSYHEMVTSSRGRKPLMTSEEAQQALRQGAGKAYDPNVVEAMIAVLQQGLVPPQPAGAR
jgi:HD-GYP domain-containing protein (c-di-GMP phosphodiesterase class II)/GAF domain-containing protein